MLLFFVGTFKAGSPYTITPALVVFQEGVFAQAVDAVLLHKAVNGLELVDSKPVLVLVNEVMELGAHHQFQLFIDDPLAALAQVVEALGGFAAGKITLPAVRQYDLQVAIIPGASHRAFLQQVINQVVNIQVVGKPDGVGTFRIHGVLSIAILSQVRLHGYCGSYHKIGFTCFLI